MKKQICCILLLIICFSNILAQSTISSRIIYKNYYLLHFIEHSPGVHDLICADSILNNISLDRYNALKNRNNTTEITDALKYSDEEIVRIGIRLQQIYESSTAFQNIVNDNLIPSGRYCLYQDLPKREYIVKAWEQDARGINHVIDVYGKGLKPNYPLIDSISYDINSKRFKTLISLIQNYLSDTFDENQSVFTMSLNGVASLLDINGRDEAVDYEPLSASVNETSYKAMTSQDWNKYTYSLILVLGQGPADYKEILSAEGKLRLKKAAFYYNKGLAPFIVVSGGRVHPYKTPNNESFQMKKYLMEECSIPDCAIVMEPHARHTTTNIRNTVRIMIAQNIPLNKPALISSQTDHISSVISKEFAERCLREIYVKPYKLGKRLYQDLVEFYPDQSALQINSMEPLDP